jgi:predicted amidohydrolase
VETILTDQRAKAMNKAMNTVRIATAQTPEYREDIDAALEYMAEVIARASEHGCRLLCFPECYLQGYLLDENKARQFAIDLLSSDFRSILLRLPVTDMAITFGLIETRAGSLFNSAVVIRNGSLVGNYRKTHLLKSEAFFTPGTETPVFSVDGLKFGLNICFDTNFPERAELVARQGGSLIVCLSNNMMPRERAEQYRHVHNSARAERCREQGLWLVSSDIFGERDGRVSWGPTAVIDPKGRVVAQLPLGSAGLLYFDMPADVPH